jgi:hypothetical protein
MRHFYHVYAGGAWAAPVREHIEALSEARFPGPVTIGLVGPPGDRNIAREMITLRFTGAGLHPPDTWIKASTGYEQLTLTALRDYAMKSTDDEPVLYAHTKGARHSCQCNAYWRRSMTSHVIGDWRRCVHFLSSHDAVGCHWLTPQEHHDPPERSVTTPYFGGNFWWARSGYIRCLPVLDNTSRFGAESWIGQAGPRVCNLLPGWPDLKPCAPA